MRLLLPLLLAFAVTTDAADADDPCAYQDEHDLRVDAAGTTFYVVNDEECQPVVGDGSCVFSLWIYEESNGRDGLQRGCDVFGDRDCTQVYCEGDRIVF